MLTAVRTRWFSWDFTVTDGERPVAHIEMSRWRERGVFAVQGVSYRVYREGRMSGDFLLRGSGTTVARARKPSAFRRTFLVEHEGQHYVLRKRSFFGRAFVLLRGDREVGSVSRVALFSRSAAIDLPADLPLAVQLFITWLVLIAWKRSARAAAAAG